MKAAQTLRRPAHWQDFEDLCKKLWGEIWNHPEIQKNGRLGQDQSGVDIFGIPENEKGYYGIQCKGKSEYNDNQYHHPQFTEKEITDEIEKAKAFEPPLKKLYFATTAESDSKIQTFIRKKNLEHKQQNLFEVHLYSWEAIVNLIDENKHTHDWYVRNQNYKANHNVAVTFDDGTTELTIKPRFKKLLTGYIKREKSKRDDLLYGLSGHSEMGGVVMPSRSLFGVSGVNLSFCSIIFKIANTGIEPLEEYKLLFSFDEAIQNTDDTNDANEIRAINPKKRMPDIFFDLESKSGKVIPQESILVGDDNFYSDELFIKPFPKDYCILIAWKLVSKNFKAEGQLKINILPEWDIDHKTVISYSAEPGVKESIEDFIEPKKD